MGSKNVNEKWSILILQQNASELPLRMQVSPFVLVAAILFLLLPLGGMVRAVSCVNSILNNKLTAWEEKVKHNRLSQEMSLWDYYFRTAAIYALDTSWSHGSPASGNRFRFASVNMLEPFRQITLSLLYRKKKPVENIPNEQLKTYCSPCQGMISSGYGSRTDPVYHRYAIHEGIDIAGRLGSDVNTVADGSVAYAGYKPLLGNVVIIKHRSGVKTLYAHLQKITVDSGATIKSGDRIGLIGMTGKTTGAHLHFEVRKNGKLLNPADFFREGDVLID